MLPSSMLFSDQLGTATSGADGVTPGLRCTSLGRAPCVCVLVITAKRLGRAGLAFGGHRRGQRLKVRCAKTETLPIDV